MSILRAFFEDESGVVVSAELVIVGTVGVLAMTAGLGVAASATNDELIEWGQAIRSLDQSYEVKGQITCCGFTATSKYTQAPVTESIAELCAEAEPHKRAWVVEPRPVTQVNPAGEATRVIEVPVLIQPSRVIGAGTVSAAEEVLSSP